MNRNGEWGSGWGSGRDRALIYGAAIFVVLLALLALAVSANATLLLDRSVTLDIQSLHPAAWNALMFAISWIGYPPQTLPVYIGWVIALGLLWGWRAFIEGSIGLGGTAVTGEVVKNLLNRPRPDGPGIFVATRGLEGGRFSFPAGHVEAITAVGLLTLWIVGQTVRNRTLVLVLRILIVVLVILMGVSRVYLGEHWFTDDLGGYLIGFIWSFIAIYLSHHWLSRKMAYRHVKD